MVISPEILCDAEYILVNKIPGYTTICMSDKSGWVQLQLDCARLKTQVSTICFSGSLYIGGDNIKFLIMPGVYNVGHQDKSRSFIYLYHEKGKE